MKYGIILFQYHISSKKAIEEVLESISISGISLLLEIYCTIYMVYIQYVNIHIFCI